jgi:caffeoyl-CoA O-methyltransferase
MITPEPIENYCVSHSSKLSPLFQELKAATIAHAPQAAQMQVGPLEGNFLSVMTKITRAITVLEFGTFTGFSSICFALSLPDNGKVTTLDRDPKATAVAVEFWKKFGIDQKVELILGDGRTSVQTLETEITSGSRPKYDLAFIDADKAGYETYFEACLKLVKKGGAILVDNVLWSGAVLDPQDASDHTIHAFNEKLKNDARIELVMLPIRDGISLAYVK